MIFSRTLLSLSIAFASVASAAQPVSAYIGFPEIEDMKISPGGKYIAVVKRAKNSELVSVLRYPGFTVSTNRYMGYFAEVDSLHWVNDDRLIIQPARQFPGVIAYKQPTGEILAMDPDGKRVDMVFGYNVDEERASHLLPKRYELDLAAEIVAVPYDDDNSVILQTSSYNPRTDSSSLQRLDTRKARLARLSGSPVNRARFFLDSKYRPLFVNGETETGDYQSFQYQATDKSWKMVSFSPQTTGKIFPFAETANAAEFLALDDVATATRAVVVWNPATKAKRTLFHSDVSDAAIAGFDPANHVWLYSFTDHYPGYWYPEPDHPLALAHKAIRAAFENAEVSFTSATRDLSLAIARVSAPTLPTIYCLVDVQNRKILLSQPSRPALKQEDFSPMTPIEVKVRDGLEIRGYLTTPRGSSGKNLPMVVVVHGGPGGVFDRYEFNDEVQLLASRGYEVLQINYRGSGGRGSQFEALGFGKWGREIQDDITDAVTFVVKSGVADPDRICIYGKNFGAYAALTGVSREPDLYKCAIGMSGFYDLPLMFTRGDAKEREADVNYLRKSVGADEEELRRRSPVNNADKIKAQVMLIHGREDDTAPITHARRMREALRTAGNEPVWISELGEAHGIQSADHREKVYSEILAFLDKNIAAAAGR